MGNTQNFCLRPQIEGVDKEIISQSDYKYKKIHTSFSSRTNKSNESTFHSINSLRPQRDGKSLKENLHSPLNLKRIITIQKYIRFGLALKRFNEQVELLSNILKLDSSVNLIPDKITENRILSSNKGELLSRKLLAEKKIPNYLDTRYYRNNIRKYKPNRYLWKTPLTYVDKYKNSNLYIGTWTLEKAFHGYGILYIEDNKYEGFWNFGRLEGECRYFLQNNEYFIGNFVEGQACGYGKYFHNDGTVYEGQWNEDQPDGKGKEIFTDNSVFEGIFENGVKRQGKFMWNDGTYYDGEINNNIFEGHGKFHWKEGREYCGEWKNGKMNGQGIMHYPDGARYEGDFVDGKREGTGTYIWDQNKYYYGTWLRGKQEGNGSFYNKGKVINGLWKEGKLVIHLSKETKLGSYIQTSGDFDGPSAISQLNINNTATNIKIDNSSISLSYYKTNKIDNKLKYPKKPVNITNRNIRNKKITKKDNRNTISSKNQKNKNTETGNNNNSFNSNHTIIGSSAKKNIQKNSCYRKINKTINNISFEVKKISPKKKKK